MRKVMIGLILAILWATQLPAQAFTVTLSAGNGWCPGTAHRITWTQAGVLQGTVTIRLRVARSSETTPAVLTLASRIRNDGAFPWTVPGSLAPGEYFIRVRRDDSTEFGDSAIFRIPQCVTFMPVILPPIDPCVQNQHAETDLRLENVLFRIDTSNPNVYHYSFWIRNVGPRCIKTLSWKMVCQHGKGTEEFRGNPPTGKYDASGGEWVLKAGEYKSVFGTLTLGVNIIKCHLTISTGVSYATAKIVIDPNNDVIENNEHNNESTGTENPGSWRVGSGDGFFRLYFNYDND